MNNDPKTNCFLSVIIISAGRDEYLAKCIQSLKKAIDSSNRKDNVEVVLIGDNVAEAYADYTYVNIIRPGTPKKSLMRNAAIDGARGEILYYIDDDVTVPEDFIDKLIEKFESNQDIDIIGGPNIAPEDSSYFEMIQDYILSSSWGASSMSTRYKKLGKDIQATQKNLILCNLGFRKKVLKRTKGFDSRLHYNEENELLAVLHKKGCKMLHSPEIVVYHYRRKKLFPFIKQVYSSGYGRAVSIKISKDNFELLYLLPAFFVFYLMGFVLPDVAGSVYNIPMVIYIFISLLSSLRISSIIDPQASLVVFFMYFVSHVSYGAGIIAGLLSKVREK